MLIAVCDCVRLCAVCGVQCAAFKCIAVCGRVRQCARQCVAVRQCAPQCAAVQQYGCGCVRQSSSVHIFK
jgi:hypothetical protein